MMSIVEQLGQQIGLAAACRQLSVARSSLYRCRQPKAEAKPQPTPKRALSPDERAEVRAVLNSERFQDSPPRQVYATLLDEAHYLCHWRTMYRILAQYQEVVERREQRQPASYHKPQLVTTAPNQVWSWDITHLKGPVKWSYFYLYVILDIFSRYVVGWLIAEQESAELAQRLIAQTCVKQGIKAEQLTLHSDRGSPMTSNLVSQLLTDLGIIKSHARPRVADDNPYSEAQFKTLKYRPDYPDRFQHLPHARQWAQSVFNWYNHDHYHSALGLLTPASVHYGQADTILSQRQQVLQAAYLAHPERFVKGWPVVPAPSKEVWINQPKTDPIIVL